jgi:hypothetical protein
LGYREKAVDYFLAFWLRSSVELMRGHEDPPAARTKPWEAVSQFYYPKLVHPHGSEEYYMASVCLLTSPSWCPIFRDYFCPNPVLCCLPHKFLSQLASNNSQRLKLRKTNVLTLALGISSS